MIGKGLRAKIAVGLGFLSRRTGGPNELARPQAGGINTSSVIKPLGSKDIVQRLRAFVILIVTIAILYFTLGGIACALGWFDLTAYAVAGGIVGSIASTLGLISLSRPALAQSDLESIEIESLQKIAVTTKDIQQLELRRATQKEEIASLEQQRKELEVLVQRASLSLFLKEQHKHQTERIANAIRKSESLRQSLEEISRIEKKIAALDDEIETDPNVDLLKSIIRSAQVEQDDWLDDLPFPFRAYGRLLKQVSLAIGESVRLVTRT